MERHPAPVASSVRPPVLFVHVMKTGGTTLARTLRETLAPEEVYPHRALDIRHDEGEVDIRHHLSVPYLAALSPERRRTIKLYVGHFPFVVRDVLGIELQTTTILRDPVERTLSLLRQFQRKQPWTDDATDRRPLAARTLEEMYDHPVAFGPLIHNHQTKIFSMTTADEPQTYMDVIDVDDHRLALAKANLEQVDVLGIIERYDQFLDEVEERFEWPVSRGVRQNVTPDSALVPIAPSLRRRIEADNAIDIELYEHAKGLVELRKGRRTIA